MLKKEREFTGDIDVMYISNNFVIKNDLRSLQYYSQFLSKINRFKVNGKKLTILEKLSNLLDENIDKYYKNDPLLSKEENQIRKIKLIQTLLEQADCYYS